MATTFFDACKIVWNDQDEGKSMERALARHVAQVGYRSFGELTALLPILKEHCDPIEFEQLAKAIAAIGAEILTEVLNKIYASQPGLEQEVESSIKKYGRLI